MRLYTFSVAGWDSSKGNLSSRAGYIWAKSDEEAKSYAESKAAENYPGMLVVHAICPTDIALSFGDTLVQLKS